MPAARWRFHGARGWSRLAWAVHMNVNVTEKRCILCRHLFFFFNGKKKIAIEFYPQARQVELHNIATHRLHGARRQSTTQSWTPCLRCLIILQAIDSVTSGAERPLRLLSLDRTHALTKLNRHGQPMPALNYSEHRSHSSGPVPNAACPRRRFGPEQGTVRSTLC